jgi:hypothetical protein
VEDGKWISPKRKALAKTDKLVIDDIAMLFDETYDEALRLFAVYVTLPNASKITFCQDKSMKWIKDYDRRTYGQMMYRALPKSRAETFATVVPLKDKDVCIRFPPRGDFQRDTSSRILEFIGYFAGKSTIRFHQSVNDQYLTLNTIRRAKCIYSFYPDPSGIPAKRLLFQHFRKMVAKQVLWLRQFAPGPWNELNAKLEAILNSEEDPDDKMEAARKAIRDPSHLPQQGVRGRFAAYVYGPIEQVFSEMMAALNPDCESACPCCGEKGSPINT